MRVWDSNYDRHFSRRLVNEGMAAMPAWRQSMLAHGRECMQQQQQQQQQQQPQLQQQPTLGATTPAPPRAHAASSKSSKQQPASLDPNTVSNEWVEQLLMTAMGEQQQPKQQGGMQQHAAQRGGARATGLPVLAYPTQQLPPTLAAAQGVSGARGDVQQQQQQQEQQQEQQLLGLGEGMWDRAAKRLKVIASGVGE
jgi:hypothetical protein